MYFKNTHMYQLWALHSFSTLFMSSSDTMKAWVNHLKGARNELWKLVLPMLDDFALTFLLCGQTDEWNTLSAKALKNATFNLIYLPRLDPHSSHGLRSHVQHNDFQPFMFPKFHLFCYCIHIPVQYSQLSIPRIVDSSDLGRFRL